MCECALIVLTVFFVEFCYSSVYSFFSLSFSVTFLTGAKFCHVAKTIVCHVAKLIVKTKCCYFLCSTLCRSYCNMCKIWINRFAIWQPGKRLSGIYTCGYNLRWYQTMPFSTLGCQLEFLPIHMRQHIQAKLYKIKLTQWLDCSGIHMGVNWVKSDQMLDSKQFWG